MSEQEQNPRDTHFAGFAKHVVEEIYQLDLWIDTTSPNITVEIEQIIAHRAYDLAQHVIGSLNSYLYDVSVDDMKLINYVDDMPALPRVENE